MQKISKNYKQFAKTEIIEAIKIISFYLNIVYFFQFLVILIQPKLYWKKK